MWDTCVTPGQWVGVINSGHMRDKAANAYRGDKKQSSDTCGIKQSSALTTASHRARAHPHALCARTRTHALRANGTRPCAHALPLHSHRLRRQRLCSGFDVCPDGLMVAT